MKITEKVAVCNANGELELSNTILQEMILQGKYSVEQMCSTTNGAAGAIRFAAFCSQIGQERTAISTLREIWHAIHISEGISPASRNILKEKIHHEVSLLWHSPDEYVWEEASQFPF